MKLAATLALGLAVVTCSAAFAETCADLRDEQPGGMAKVCVSSVLPPRDGATFGHEQLVGASDGHAWCTEAAKDGVGQTVTVRWPNAAEPTGLQVVNGRTKDNAIDRSFGRLRAIRIEASNGLRRDVTLRDAAGLQDVTLRAAGPAQWIKVTVLSVYRGSKVRAACLDYMLVDFLGPGIAPRRR